MSDRYEIRVRGCLSEDAHRRLSDAVGSLTTETVLHAAVRDQAELRGILARLDELGCELLEARRVMPRTD